MSSSSLPSRAQARQLARKKRINATDKPAHEHESGTTVPKSAPAGNDVPSGERNKYHDRASVDREQPLPDDEEELVSSQNPSRRDIDEP
ncbi:conserved hypothetical protein [Mesorhizobium sp. ORS 3324]|nr:conserved hypothetical protein [Mesorhizobium sp. ORS 3324]